jgi:hypothetical protein
MVLTNNRKENPQNQKREIIGRESDWQKLVMATRGNA